jgi:branched-chain amino acid transport system ATP-binding protein
MTPLLHLNDVSRFFGALKAVDGVSVTVAAGEALGVIGPNGAGKTTLFNLVTGDVPSSRGQIVFDGTDSPGCRHMRGRGSVSAAPTKSRTLSRL